MLPNIRILTLSFEYLNSALILPKALEFLGLSFQIMEFWSYPSKHWNSDLIQRNTGILAFSFQTLELFSFSFSSKQWNSGLILPNIGILTLSNETLEFLPFRFKRWNCFLFLFLSNIGILTVSFQTWDF